MHPGEVIYSDEGKRFIFQPEYMILVEKSGVKRFEHSVAFINQLSDVQIKLVASGKSTESIDRAIALISEAYNLDKYEVIYADDSHQFLWSNDRSIASVEMERRAQRHGKGWKLFQQV